MFYQVLEEGRVISKSKSRREALEAAAQDLDRRTLRSVGYKGSILRTIHEYSRDEVEEGLRRLQLRLRASPGASLPRSFRSRAKTATDVPSS